MHLDRALKLSEIGFKTNFVPIPTFDAESLEDCIAIRACLHRAQRTLNERGLSNLRENLRQNLQKPTLTAASTAHTCRLSGLFGFATKATSVGDKSTVTILDTRSSERSTCKSGARECSSHACRSGKQENALHSGEGRTSCSRRPSFNTARSRIVLAVPSLFCTISGHADWLRAKTWARVSLRHIPRTARWCSICRICAHMYTHLDASSLSPSHF